jgi:hypothetical protein
MRGMQYPEAWLQSVLIGIYKQGDAAAPNKYKPISLSSVGYTIIVDMLLKCL